MARSRPRPRRPRAVVAMSGGVDSSVAAALLVDEGFDVTGFMLKLWRGEAANNDSGCCNVGAAEDARRVADALGIRFYVLNFAERFEDTVVRDFHSDYAAGRTPNPCVRCNQWVKFGALFERAKALGAEVFATGHYARVRRAAEGWRLYRGMDEAKDQSYVLWMLNQHHLSGTRFPVGEQTKAETREIAASLGLRTAAKPDSQEICFVPGGDVARYVDSAIPAAAVPGDVVDAQGRVLGRHGGIGHFTVGQRKGLGISLGVPVYVTGIDAASRTVQVGVRADLGVKGLVAAEASFVGPVPPMGTPVLVQHRAHGEIHPAVMGEVSGRRVDVNYESSADAMARGQSAVFYSAADPDRVLGGGIVEATAPVGVVGTSV